MSAHISIPMYQRSVTQRYRLVGLKCKECGEINFPPKGVCYKCRKGTEFEEMELSGAGEVYAYTVIAGAGAPPEFATQAQAKGSYPVAIIQLQEGPRVIAQLVDIEKDQIKVGMRVKAVFRRIYEEENVIRYGFKFRPVV